MVKPGRLAELLTEGGLEVVTPPFPAPGRADTPGSRRIRTVIQPDGDLLVFVTPDALTDTRLWQQHQQALADILTGLERNWQGLAKALPRLGLLILAGSGIVSFQDLSEDGIIQQIEVLVAGPLLGGGLGLVPRLLGWWVKRAIRRRFEGAGLLGRRE